MCVSFVLTDMYFCLLFFLTQKTFMEQNKFSVNSTMKRLPTHFKVKMNVLGKLTENKLSRKKHAHVSYLVEDPENAMCCVESMKNL